LEEGREQVEKLCLRCFLSLQKQRDVLDQLVVIVKVPAIQKSSTISVFGRKLHIHQNTKSTEKTKHLHHSEKT
jgi:hypothetical protein